MSVFLTINGHTTPAAAGEATVFDFAEKLGVQVPTSCVKQGKCKECIVEVAAGMDCLSGRTPAEQHLTGNFRLSCQARIVADTGDIKCHTMRRGNMRIERRALGMPASHE